MAARLLARRQRGTTCVLVAAIAGCRPGRPRCGSRSSQPRSRSRSSSRGRSRREAAAHAGRGRRAELERTLADRGEPPDQEQPPDRRPTCCCSAARRRQTAEAFDDTARAHPLDRDAPPPARGERRPTVEAPALLASIAARAPVPVAVEAEPRRLRPGDRAEGRTGRQRADHERLAARRGADRVRLDARRGRSCSASTTARAGADARRARPRARPPDRRAGPRRQFELRRAPAAAPAPRSSSRRRRDESPGRRRRSGRSRSASPNDCARSGTSRSAPPPTARRRSRWRRTSLPDLYLFDIEMPTVDGLAAAAQLARLGPPPAGRGRDRRRGSGPRRALDRHRRQRLPDQADRRPRARRGDQARASRHAEFEALEAEVDKAQQALEDRKLVERAKGLLMTALKLSEQDAFRRLQKTARERNLRLADVARTDRRAAEPAPAEAAPGARLAKPSRGLTPGSPGQRDALVPAGEGPLRSVRSGRAGMNSTTRRRRG